MFRRKAAAALAIAALALTGCSAANDDAGGTSGGTLTLGAISAPTTFDPAGAEWGNRAPFYQAVFDTLLVATPEGTLEPWLATEWSYNDDNTVLTLTLRDDVTFSDGATLDAEAVKTNLEHFRDGTGPDANNLAGVTVEAPDASTVVLTLEAPNPALLDYLSRDAGLVASPDSLDSADVDTDPIGSGPYLLDTETTVTGTSYAYTKNPDYWNPEVQHYDDLVIRVLGDMTAAVNAIKAGEVNGQKLSNNSVVAEVEGAGFTVTGNERDWEGLFLVDRAGILNPALGDVRVRQALNHAFDKEGLLQALQNGNGTPTTQVFPTSSAAYDEALDDRYPYDPEKAKELLAEAGYADGFELVMPSTAQLPQNMFTLVQQQLKDIGVTVSYTDVGTNLIADLLAPKYAASWMALEQNPDWQLIQFQIAPTATFNPAKYEDPKVDEFIQRIQYGDEAEQDAAAKELNEYIVEQAWFAPWYRVQGNFATDANTEVEILPSNTYPNIYDIRPKG